MDRKDRNRQKKSGWQTQIVLIFTLLAAIVALSTTLLLAIGMLPTMVSLFIDRTSEKTRALTVGAMNAAGCAPFVLQLWTTGTSMDNALSIIGDPRTIIVMYCAAGVGYIVDWSVSGLVGTIMIERGQSRRKYIEKRQAEMIERWGQEVSGEAATYAIADDGAGELASEAAPEQAGAGSKDSNKGGHGAKSGYKLASR